LTHSRDGSFLVLLLLSSNSGNIVFTQSCAVPCLVKSETVQQYLCFLSFPRRDVKYA